MMVCVCNRITDAHVRAAIQKGAQKPADVFKILGVPRSCGSCSDAMDAIFEQVKAEILAKAV